MYLKKALCLSLVGALLPLALAFSSSHGRIESLRRKYLTENTQNLLRESAVDNVAEHRFNQRVDHGNSSYGTFPQKYYISTSFYRPGGPVYLYNGGEGELGPWAIGGQLANLANATGGLVIAMEHRYYGVSVPVEDMRPGNMRFLTVEQSLEDMAHFIRTYRGVGDIRIPGIARWVVVGGSYPGNLAAWMRLKYPELVFASYSSSAPVQVKADFFEYDQAVADGLPPACTEALAKATEGIDEVLLGGNRAAILGLKSAFGLEEVTSDADFASALTDAPAFIVQYGDMARTKIHWMERLCGALGGNGTERVEGYGGKGWREVAGLAVFQREWMDINEITPEDYSTVANATGNEENRNGSRAWTFQTCLEFAYWQTAPPTPLRALRSRLMDVEYYEAGCKGLFGDAVPAHAAVGKLNRVYGGDRISLDRMVSVNGELDPWRRLSISGPNAPPRTSSPSRPVYLMEGGHHCTDLSGRNPTETASQRKIKEAIISDIAGWLHPAPRPGGLLPHIH